MRDGRYYLAMKNLMPILNGIPNYLTVSTSGNYEKSSWKPRLDQWQEKIDALRVWVKSLGWLDRRAYAGWLDFYQRKLDSAWSELNTQKEKRHMEEYERGLREKEESIQSFARKTPFPKPPGAQ